MSYFPSKKKIVQMGNISGQYEPIVKIKDESGMETTYYSSVYESVPEEFETKAAKKLNENEELKRNGLQELKEYLERNHMTSVEDHILLTILRLSRYDLENAEEKLNKFLHKREQIIRMLVDVETGKIESMIDDMFFGVLPYRDKKGNVIVFIREGAVNLEQYSAHEVGIVGMTFGLFLLKYPLSTVTGFSCFADSAGVTRYITSILREVPNFMFILFAFPIRVSNIEVFNESFICRIFVNMASQFVDSRIIRNIHWHGSNFQDLHSVYDPYIVPEEFGGNMGPLCNVHYREKFLDFVQELKNENVS